MVIWRCLNFVRNEHRKGLIDFECATQIETSPIDANNDNVTFIRDIALT